MIATIEEIMAYLAVSVPAVNLTIRTARDVPNQPHDYPEMADYEGPVTGQPVEPPGTPAPTPQPVTGQPVGTPGGSLPSYPDVVGQPVGDADAWMP